MKHLLLLLACTLLILQTPTSALAQSNPDEVYYELGSIMRNTPKGQRTQKLDEYFKTIDPVSKYYVLNIACQAALEEENYKQAEVWGKELLATAKKKPNDWNYGNAIHYGNNILGIVSLKNGDIKSAKDYLHKAAETPGSPQLNSYGPDLQLARKLLVKKEFEAVKKYLEASRKFYKPQQDLVGDWIKLVAFLETHKGSPLDFFKVDQEKANSYAKTVLEFFWGRAKLADGSIAEPKDEKERTTVPVSDESALRIVKTGTTSGLAESCRLPWKNFFSEFMQREKERDLTMIQKTFTGVLHGFSQSRAKTTVRLLECTDELVAEIENKMSEVANAEVKGKAKPTA